MDVMWWETKKIVNVVPCDTAQILLSPLFSKCHTVSQHMNTEGCKVWIPDTYHILFCCLSMLYFIVNYWYWCMCDQRVTEPTCCEYHITVYINRFTKNDTLIYDHHYSISNRCTAHHFHNFKPPMYGLPITSSKHELLEKIVNFNFIFIKKNSLNLHILIDNGVYSTFIYGYSASRHDVKKYYI